MSASTLLDKNKSLETPTDAAGILREHYGDTLRVSKTVSKISAQQIQNIAQGRMISLRSGRLGVGVGHLAVTDGDRGDSYYLYVCLSGVLEIESAHRAARVSAGGLLMVDGAERFSVKVTALTHLVSIRLERYLVDESYRSPKDLLWEVTEGADAFAAITAASLQGFASSSRFSESTRDQEMLSQILAEAALKYLSTNCSTKDRSVEHDKLAKAKRYILKYISDPDLSAERVAKGVGLSTRSLYRLFSDDSTTFMRWLISKRIEASYEALAAGNCRDVTDAAFSNGFKNLSHFSRSFRKQYRRSPVSVLRSQAV
ncbi:helix-turn-helix domain-containing protein [Pseudomonas putida]|uniref:helix-turn-helix domain-containing protein n=1 Tax=Pseudomonas putida TaxID=303 RepID=UPI002364A743|nr:helix-turn-helix domain-containing protein [Pseudomonas putida]MDD1963817.1 helix-turn-helix domain-containing protein [Pseudomonas putida]